MEESSLGMTPHLKYLDPWWFYDNYGITKEINAVNSVCNSFGTTSIHTCIVPVCDLNNF